MNQKNSETATRPVLPQIENRESHIREQWLPDFVYGGIMKLGELLTIVDELKPNHYSAARKIKWVDDLEHRIYEQVIYSHENEENLKYTKINEDSDYNTELVGSGIFEDMYRFYLESMIDLSNQEINKYNNSASMFNEFYENYKDWYRTKHMPVHKTDIPIFNGGK